MPPVKNVTVLKNLEICVDEAKKQLSLDITIEYFCELTEKEYTDLLTIAKRAAPCYLVSDYNRLASKSKVLLYLTLNQRLVQPRIPKTGFSPDIVDLINRTRSLICDLTVPGCAPEEKTIYTLPAEVSSGINYAFTTNPKYTDLYFTWFDGVYNQDIDSSQPLSNAALAAVSAINTPSQPIPFPTPQRDRVLNPAQYLHDLAKTVPVRSGALIEPLENPVNSAAAAAAPIKPDPEFVSTLAKIYTQRSMEHTVAITTAQSDECFVTALLRREERKSPAAARSNAQASEPGQSPSKIMKLVQKFEALGGWPSL